MSFYIIHELNGFKTKNDGRIRIRASNLISYDQIQIIYEKLKLVKGISNLKYSQKVGSFLFFYTNKISRNNALKVFINTNYTPKKRSKVRTDNTPILYGFLPLVRYIFIRPFLPPIWRMALTTIGAIPFLLKGIKSLLQFKLTVDVLDAAAIGTSLYMRDFRTVGMLTLLLGLGDTLAYWTRRHSLESLSESLALNIASVWILNENGTEISVPINTIKNNDLVVVRSGSSIPVDGIVEKGIAVVNQSSMTGEPLGVKKEKGGYVYAGTVVEEGHIVIKVTGVGDNTRFRQVAKFIEESESLKAGIQGKFERLADIAVPFTFALAGIVWLFTRNFARAASVLLVDYSCALKLATPLGILATMREGAKNGIIIKGGKYIEAINEVDTIVFDKTGTLTKASPVVANITTTKEFSKKDILRITACLEEHYPHPVARAIVNAAKKQNIIHEEEHAEVEYVVAHGIASKLHNKKVHVGSRHYIEYDEGIDLTPFIDEIKYQSSLGRSLLYLAYDEKIAGMIAIEDPLRDEAIDVIKNLKKDGIKHIFMLTGDDTRTAQAIANSAGITEFKAQVLPSDKSTFITNLTNTGSKILMIGDGINDAPALSASHIGLAMSDGTDLAQEVANIVLTKPDLNGILIARQLAKSTMKRIHTNFILTMSLNSLFLFGGIFMLIPAGLSAILHNLTTLGITLNAMRPHLPNK